MMRNDPTMTDLILDAKRMAAEKRESMTTDQDLLDLRAKPDVSPISADAAETCIDVIYRELGKARLWHNELGSIRATMILNFGSKSKRPLIKDETATTEKILIEVLTALVNP